MGVFDGRKLSDAELYNIAGGVTEEAKPSSMLYTVHIKCHECGREFETYGNVPNLMPSSYEWFRWNYNHNRCENCREKVPCPSKDEWRKSNTFVNLKLDK